MAFRPSRTLREQIADVRHDYIQKSLNVVDMEKQHALEEAHLDRHLSGLHLDYESHPVHEEASHLEKRNYLLGEQEQRIADKHVSWNASHNVPTPRASSRYAFPEETRLNHQSIRASGTNALLSANTAAVTVDATRRSSRMRTSAFGAPSALSAPRVSASRISSFASPRGTSAIRSNTFVEPRATSRVTSALQPRASALGFNPPRLTSFDDQHKRILDREAEFQQEQRQRELSRSLDVGSDYVPRASARGSFRPSYTQPDCVPRASARGSFRPSYVQPKENLGYNDSQTQAMVDYHRKVCRDHLRKAGQICRDGADNLDLNINLSLQRVNSGRVGGSRYSSRLW